jgi:divalent metal cation (Fe/Co/Zn/Cd) transporter
MKEKTNLQPLFVAIILILAGTLSPSNGIDDRVNKTPLELIITALVIVFAALTVYFIWNRIEKYKESQKTSYNSNEETTLTSID